MKEKIDFPARKCDYIELYDDPLYVDKTLFIKEFEDRGNYANIIVRPHGFGKSVNMSMLKTFYEKTDEDTSVYFRDKLIWKEGEKYTNKQGKYPVIYMSFAGVTGKTWKKMYEDVKRIISNEFSRHGELRDSDKVDEDDLREFLDVCVGKAKDVFFRNSLLNISRMLRAHYGEKAIVLIDDYDAPLRRAYEGGYLEEAEDFFFGFWGTGLKDNDDVKFSVLAGVLDKPASDGFNNPCTYTALDKDFSTSFGFTDGEVKDLLNRRGCSEKYDEIERMYGGFNFSGNEMFNSGSVMKYLETGKAEPYYSDDDEKMMRKIVESASEGMLADLDKFRCEERYSLCIRKRIRGFHFDSFNAFDYLFFLGYITSKEPDTEKNEKYRVGKYEYDWYYFIEIPNEEMRAAFGRVMPGTTA